MPPSSRRPGRSLEDPRLLPGPGSIVAAETFSKAKGNAVGLREALIDLPDKAVPMVADVGGGQVVLPRLARSAWGYCAITLSPTGLNRLAGMMLPGKGVFELNGS